MVTIDERIRSLDTGLFDSIPSQTSDEDKKALLLLQRCVRSRGEYVYLEIGSHLGGTIQPFYIDPLCTLVYSIDKRPVSQPDERGRVFEYPENSTERMLSYLSSAFPSVDESKIKTYDCDACEVDAKEISEKPDLCFIDGEHTNNAVVSDFEFCFKAGCRDAIIAFHDTCFVHEGIINIKKRLSDRSIRFRGFMLDGSIYAILLNDAVDRCSEAVEPFSKSEADYFRESSKTLLRMRLTNRIRRYPVLHKCLKWVKEFF